MAFFPVFAGVLVGIYDGCCNQCVGDPKHLMFLQLLKVRFMQ